MHKFNDVWTSYNLFFSVPFVQDFLKKRYQKLNYSDAEQHSFKNSYPFIYYL
ncbi:MAG: YaaC family protein, partial [Psychrobacillus sp.]